MTVETQSLDSSSRQFARRLEGSIAQAQHICKRYASVAPCSISFRRNRARSASKDLVESEHRKFEVFSAMANVILKSDVFVDLGQIDSCPGQS